MSLDHKDVSFYQGDTQLFDIIDKDIVRAS